MRKPWSAFLITAALVWLLLLFTSPAWTYYPPVAATASKTPGSLTVTVFNPKTQTGFSETWYVAPGDEFVDLQQQNGVIAWVLRSGSNYSVTCCTYDPVLHPSDVTTNHQGPFTSVSQLQVADGVVAYVAGISGHYEPRYGTYDPARQAWQMYGQNWYLSGMQLQSIATKDGVVVYQYTWPEMPTPYLFDCWIYDPQLGMWWGSGMDNWDPFLYVNISSASVYYAAPIPGGGVLYDNFGCMIGLGNGWHLGSTTPPQACLVAQPTSGTAHLWVWFTDMSIGGTGWSWDFGDGNTSTSRSTYHNYLTRGTYQAWQTVSRSMPTPVISLVNVSIQVKAAGVGPLLPLLLD